MNLFNLLTKEKHVAGIEIDDSVVRVAFLSREQKGWQSYFHTKQDFIDPKQKLIILEELLPKNVVVEGVVIDHTLLAKTIRGIWLKAKLKTNYAIVAIPDDQIYLRIFSFPKSVDKLRLKEAMNLGVSFQLPMKFEDVYFDWERISSTEPVNEVLLSAIPKTVANGYIDALNLAGIKPIALESHLASIARAVQTESKDATIFTKKTDDDATIFILKERTVRFSRAVPTRFVSKVKFANEVKKIKLAFESEMPKDAKAMSVIDIDDAKIQDEYANFEELVEPKTKWLVALGAAIRGSIPEGDDNMISLLPIKTEEMYAYQKASTFITLISNMIISVSIFFVLAFLSIYFLMLSLSQTINRSLANNSSSVASSEILLKESSINNINLLTSTAKEILSETPMWSILLEELQSRTIPGIIISTLNVPSLSGDISISGIAKDRITLNQFKKTLQDSQMFSNVVLPINNLEQKENLTFSISMHIKDTSKLYYK